MGQATAQPNRWRREWSVSAARRFIWDEQHKVDKMALTKAKGGKNIPNKMLVKRSNLDVAADREFTLCFSLFESHKSSRPTWESPPNSNCLQSGWESPHYIIICSSQ